MRWLFGCSMDRRRAKRSQPDVIDSVNKSHWGMADCGNNQNIHKKDIREQEQGLGGEEKVAAVRTNDRKRAAGLFQQIEWHHTR